jgi:hypothetical protein
MVVFPLVGPEVPEPQAASSDNISWVSKVDCLVGVGSSRRREVLSVRLGWGTSES